MNFTITYRVPTGRKKRIIINAPSFEAALNTAELMFGKENVVAIFFFPNLVN